MSSWKIVQKYAPAPSAAAGTAEKLQTLLSSHWLIFQARVIYCSSSPMASAFTCSSVLGQVLNSREKEKMLSHLRRSHDFKNIPHLFECKMDSLMFGANSCLFQAMNGMEGCRRTYWNLRVRSPFCLHSSFAPLPCLKFGAIHRLWSHPKPVSFLEYNITKFLLLKKFSFDGVLFAFITTSDSFQSKKEKLRLDIGSETFPTWGQWRSGTCCPENLCHLQPWMFSRPV